MMSKSNFAAFFLTGTEAHAGNQQIFVRLHKRRETIRTMRRKFLDKLTDTAGPRALCGDKSV